MPACVRAHIYNIVGCAHYFFVVLHDSDCVAKPLQFAQHPYKAVSVARMQTY
jgi:hypothetical protein